MTLAIVHATARVRCTGTFTPDRVKSAWRDIRGATEALAWLSEANVAGEQRVSDDISDADAMEECYRLLAQTRTATWRVDPVDAIIQVVRRVIARVNMETT